MNYAYAYSGIKQESVYLRVSKISRFEKIPGNGNCLRGNREKPGKTGKSSYGYYAPSFPHLI
jgi:hypothetical protein